MGFFRGIGPYLRDYFQLRMKAKATWRILPNFPCFDDRRNHAGSVMGHYFYQDLYVARRIYSRSPSKHVDVGSRLDGFIAHLAVFRQVEVRDIRPLRISVPNVTFWRTDITAKGAVPADYCDSVSCLHSIEHFGLGRYGDSIDGDGWIHGLTNLVRMLRVGGVLYLSCPIGRQRVDFNAHRVFGINTILVAAEKLRLQLLSFAFVDDQGRFTEAYTLTAEDLTGNLGLDYGCGIFEFEKAPG